MLLFCSSMLTGQHDATQLPVVLLAAAADGSSAAGCSTIADKPNRQMCRLYLSMMDKMNVHLDKFGDANEPLDEV